MKRISVFCGSSSGNDPIFQETAYELGRTLAKKNIEIVYGGADLGLMRAVADGALSEGGKVIGVLPVFLKNKEIAHKDLSELILVGSMHERKMMMNELSDGVIALPGGFGTFDEFFEMLTWGQLGLHSKPVALLNVNGFYDCLIELLKSMVDKGFLKEENRQMVLLSDNIEDVLNIMENYQPKLVNKWITNRDV